MDLTSLKKLVVRGVRRPHRVPSYLIGRLFPESGIGPNWKYQGGLITFTDGGFVSSPSNRREFSAKLYGEVTTVSEILSDHVGSVDSALEIGCGYGRLTPWIGEFADDVHGIDINTDAIESASELYPDIEFRQGRADNLPYHDSQFGLVFAWTVLQHIPPENIDQTGDEISRVLDDDGYVLVCDRVRRSGPNTWTRTPEEYEEVLDATLVTKVQKPMEETRSEFSEGSPEDVMLFRAN